MLPPRPRPAATTLQPKSLVPGQRPDDTAEQVVLDLLLHRQIVERHQAGMLPGLRILDRPKLPALGQFLRHPRFMAGLRAGIGVVQMHLDDMQRTLALPGGRILPGRLAMIAERLAVGAIDFVGDAGDFFLGHRVSLSGQMGQRLFCQYPGRNQRMAQRQGFWQTIESSLLQPTTMPNVSSFKTWAKALKQHTLTVYFAARDPRTPLLVRLLALLVAAYALSPIDLIPDFIPVIGYLDDLLLLPLGIALVVRLTPPEVIASAREQAAQATERPVSRGAAVAVVGLWVVLAVIAARWAVDWLAVDNG